MSEFSNSVAGKITIGVVVTAIGTMFGAVSDVSAYGSK